MQPYQQRVVEEKEELDKKLTALRGFMQSRSFFNLDAQHRTLLREQEWAMSDYSSVLEDRIELFKQENTNV